MNPSRIGAGVGLVLLAACGGAQSDEGGGQGGGENALATQAVPRGPDPCTLVSQAEVERFMGPLAEPPYRVNPNRRTDPAGDFCLYRDQSSRYVVIGVDWDDGPLVMKMMSATTLTAEDLLGTRDLGADTLAGAWDQIAVTFGRLVALKDSTAVTVDPMGSRLDRAAQAKIAAIALARAGAPLDYDGAKAARARPADPSPGDPCSLVTRAEAEALMGPLAADPKASEDGTECTFPVQQEGYPMENTLTVQWSGGYYALGEERLSTGMATTVMGQDMGGIPSLETNEAGTAEPWDDAQVLLGGRITVVARDMLFQAISTGINGYDDAKARELLRIAVRRALSR